MQDNKTNGVSEGNDEAKGRTSGSNQSNEKQNSSNSADISSIDQQEGQMNNGEIGGSQSKDDSETDASK
jgi:hypothetical protein